MFDHSTSIVVGDALRITVGLILAIDLGLACAAFGIYWQANRHIRRVDPSRLGALPRYVIGVAVSYTLLAAFSIAEIQGFYGTVLTWRAPIGFIAALSGLYGMVNLLTFQGARLDIRDQSIHGGGTPHGGT